MRQQHEAIKAKQKTIDRISKAADDYAALAETHWAKADSLGALVVVYEKKIEALNAQTKEQNEKYKALVNSVVYLDADSTYRLFTKRTGNN